MKTISLKKVAVVAVASLGFGLLSVVPANAGVAAATAVNSITLAKSTLVPTQGSAVWINMGADVDTTANTARFVGAITSFPTGGFATVSADNEAAGSGVEDAGTYTDLSDEAGDTVTAGYLALTELVATEGVTASATAGNGSFVFIPTKSGSYSLTVFHDANEDGAIGVTESRQTIDITVAAAAAGYVSSKATLSAATYTDGVDYYSPAVGGSVTLDLDHFNAAGGAATAALIPAVTVALTGPGTIDATAPFAYKAAGASTPAADTWTINADGRPGKTTVTVTVGGTTVAAKTITWYGVVKTISVTGVRTIGRAGGYEAGNLCMSDGAATPACDTDTLTPGTAEAPLETNYVAIAVTPKDAAGNVVPAQTGLSMTSSAPLIVPSAITNAFMDDGTSDYTAGFGVIHTTWSTTATSKSGDKASLTFSIVNGDGDIITSSPVAVSIGGSVAKEVISFDKTSYDPGAPMTVTITATDSSGNPVYDGAASPALVASKTIGGSIAAKFYIGGKRTTTANTVFAPTNGGSFQVTGTGTDAAATAISASATVTDANAGLLTQIDALNAKIVALNALIAKIMKKLGVK